MNGETAPVENKSLVFLGCGERAASDPQCFEFKRRAVRGVSAKQAISRADADARRCRAANPRARIKCSTRPTEPLPLDTSEVTNEDKTRQITYARTKPPTPALTASPRRDNKHILYSPTCLFPSIHGPLFCSLSSRKQTFTGGITEDSLSP